MEKNIQSYCNLALILLFTSKYEKKLAPSNDINVKYKN